jgi:hypothetical protein
LNPQAFYHKDLLIQLSALHMISKNQAFAAQAKRRKDEMAAMKKELVRVNGLTRDLEHVYTAMWQRQQAGQPPADFAVTDRD